MRGSSLSVIAAVAVMMCPVLGHAQSLDKESTVSAESPADTKSVEAKSSDEKIKLAAVAVEEEAAPRETTVKTVSRPKPKRPAGPRLKAAINLSSQTMTVSVGGATRYVFKISSGRSGYRTPTGNYRPQWLHRMHYSKKYNNAPMPHSVFFHGGYAIHATNATRRLGAPASHGCVRLAPSSARTFYRMVQKYGKANTRISIRGVARDRRVYAKRKKVYRKKKKYASTSWGGWNGPAAQRKPKRRHKPRRRVAAKVYKKKSYSVSYAKPTYTWPGD